MASSSAQRSSQRSERQNHIPHGRSAASSLSRSVDNGQQLLPNNLSVRSKLHASRPSLPPSSRTNCSNHDPEPARVRVAVRLRPRNAEDLLSDADFADCVEIQPELKRLNLKKNNWSSEAYRFDEVFSESASQRRVYEVVAKPVVESVLSGYNGTVMAYGQTGTGKTYTLGRLGKDDASERGIMVRAMEDIISSTSGSDSIEISYLQTDFSRERSRIDKYSLATQVSIRRAVHEEEKEIPFQEKDSKGNLSYDGGIPIVRNSKLLIVDLAGSERLDKSGSEGHSVEEAKFINLSLTSLGKCINALAENSPHIPVRDSKLTRLLRDSFGGYYDASLGKKGWPLNFKGRRKEAMKVVNMLKLKEEFDYESLCRKLENHVDHLSAEIDRQLKLRDRERIEMERSLRECHESFDKAEKSLVARSEFLQKENAHLEIELEGTLNELNRLKDENNFMHSEVARLEISLKHVTIHGRKESDKIMVKLQESYEVHQKTANELDSLKAEYNELLTDKATLAEELNAMRLTLQIQEKQRKAVEAELVRLKKLVPENGDDYEDKKSHVKENRAKPLVLPKLNQSRETISGQRATIAKICEEGKKLVLLLSSP
ncbi:hypothetical protein RHMOL_Rhmol03G0124000 [Rhododendron molle]|uniref:Uncharacterized protein n=1 Tax=Rhododendron molle TaxID=49168 RepID=A0ACC0PEQ1_RHOML|nr:hypothetical protein RHMOL_Rhmol03G0124000 [Rhododendron molle]